MYMAYASAALFSGFPGIFVILESGRADSDWECELCGSTVELYAESDRRAL